MSKTWTHHHWTPGDERATVGDLTFDSTIHCGAGQGFQEVSRNHVRFRARSGLEPYAWRFHLCIESSGDGRELLLEVADFNHFGGELWQEQAAVVSHDQRTWEALGLENTSIVRWTPTGQVDEDESLCRGGRKPYGVRYRLLLDAPRIWVASPTPYTLSGCLQRMHVPRFHSEAAWPGLMEIPSISNTTCGRTSGATSASPVSRGAGSRLRPRCFASPGLQGKWSPGSTLPCA